MRFSCDNCSAQYMIADEKVGPRGVKVRCKKCGHIILVKPLPSEESVAAPVPAPPPAPSGELGLDVELGQAFEAMLGGQKPETASPPASELDATRPVSEEEQARLAAGGGAADSASAEQTTSSVASSGAPGDWYVAVHDQQVGPLTNTGIKDRWESGEIGPDSLVWRSGMGDWKPLSTVPALAETLSPVPRGPVRPPAEPAAPAPSAMAAVAPSAPAADSSWRPNAASALSALASEEMASLSEPPVKSSVPAAAAKSNGKGSLIESMNLPDSGGVDPTGAIPLQIKGLEATGESELRRTSSVARSAAAARGRRAVARTIMLVVVGFVGAAAAAVGGIYVYTQVITPRQMEGPKMVVVPPPAAPPVAAIPPPSAAPPLAAPAPAPEPVAQPAPVPTSPTPSPLAQAAPFPAPAVDEPAKPTQPIAAPRPPRKPPKVAVADRPVAPAPAPKPKTGGGDPLLDFDGSGNSDLENLGGSSGKKRSVYVPPAPGGDLASEVSQAEIQEGVAGKMSGLRDCLSRQEAADPNLHGVLKLRWVISADGGVSGVRSQTPEFTNQPITKCLSSVVKTIRFPRSKTSGQEVIFPFKF